MLIYLDYAATTPVDPEVMEVMFEYLGHQGIFANPASPHNLGYQAKAAVAQAQASVAEFINAEPQELIWTSGATEANNLALRGVAEFYGPKKGKHIITSKTEHKSVLDVCQFLATQGYRISYLNPDPQGLVNLSELAALITDETILVSLMLVNNETGVIQDLASIAALTREKGVFLHVDAAQGLGRVEIDVKKIPVDLMSFSGHKVYAPKGIGALYVRSKPKVKLNPQILGGGQQGNLRSGTLPVSQIMAFAAAVQILNRDWKTEQLRISKLAQQFQDGLRQIEDVAINGAAAARVAGIINASFAGIDGEALLVALNQKLAVSSGSACAAHSLEASHVLRAMGLKSQLAHSSIRFSLGRYTTSVEIEQALAHIQVVVKKLRELSVLGRPEFARAVV